MAARLTKRVGDKHREAIKVSMLRNRLTEHALSDTELMKPSQVDAAKYLINQAIGSPTSSVQHSGAQGGPIEHVHKVTREIVSAGTSDKNI